MSCLPFVEKGKKTGSPIVFMSGYPDHETSGWGKVIPEELGKKHRLIFMCLPSFDLAATGTRNWGYNFDEILTMMHNTMDRVGLSSTPFVFVAHDWGSVIAQTYVSRYPEQVSKMVLCDVGRLKISSLPLKSVLIIVGYQLFFAICYLMSQTFSISLATSLYSLFPKFKFLHPSIDEVPPIVKETGKAPSVLMCYPYYHYWRRLLTGSAMKPSFPKCPLLFMYGTKKNVFFHDEQFLERLANTEGCSSHKIQDAGHWFMISHGDATVKLLQEFLKTK
mmetsp:Transcript_24275/g.40528  ORF Transcript_24275/g.40528 Transcript_24275/m.40528 type:complete len:277 (+) Transcript_24275:72-902(+)